MTSGQFVKGDPRIKPYRKGDGRKRKPFVKGFDPRRISNERLQEVNFQKGNAAGFLRDGPKVNEDRGMDGGRWELIPLEYRVEVSPDETGLQLLERLDVAISFAMEMMETLANTTNPNNTGPVGRYEALINSMIATKAEIRGGRLDAAPLGKQTPEQVEEVKAQYARVLTAALTKLKHSIAYARRGNELGDEIFSKNGEVRTWASSGFCYLLGGVRTTILRRAELDVWEQRKNKGFQGAIEAQYRGRDVQR